MIESEWQLPTITYSEFIIFKNQRHLPGGIFILSILYYCNKLCHLAAFQRNSGCKPCSDWDLSLWSQPAMFALLDNSKLTIGR